MKTMGSILAFGVGGVLVTAALWTCAPGAAQVQPTGPGGEVLRDLRLDLSTGMGAALTENVELSFVGTAGTTEIYEQTFQGVPIYGTRVLEVLDPRRPMTFFRLYEPSKLSPVLAQLQRAEISETQALDAVLQLYPGTTLAVRRVIFPQYHYPVLLFEVRIEGPAESPVLGTVAFVDAEQGRLQRVVEPRMLHGGLSGGEGGGAYAGTPPCPDVSDRFDHAFGEGHVAARGNRCLPVNDVQVDVMTCARFDPQALNGPEGPLFLRTWLGEVAGDPFTYCPVSTAAPPLQLGNALQTAVDSHVNVWWAMDHLLAQPFTHFFPLDDTVRVIANSEDSELSEGSASYHWPTRTFHFVDGGIGPGLAPLVAGIDVVAHEVFHAVLHGASPTGLPFTTSEMTRLEEGLADVWGVFAEAQIRGTSPDWTFGEDVGVAVRDLQRPGVDPIEGFLSYSSNLFEYKGEQCTHCDATILGLAFYLIVEGGVHPASADYPGPTILPSERLTPEQARTILFLTATGRLIDGMDYCRAAVEMADTARQVYSEREARTVREAFRAVGVADQWELMDGSLLVRSLEAGERQYFRVQQGSFRAGIDDVSVSVTASPGNSFTLQGRPRYYPSREVDEVRGSPGANGTAVVSLTADPARTGVIGLSGCYDSDTHTVLRSVPRAGDLYFAIEAIDPLTDASIAVEIVEPEPLEEGVPMENASRAAGEILKLVLPVLPASPGKPFPVAPLVVSALGGSGDLDLYLAKGRMPTPEDHDLRATGPGTAHYVREHSPSPGDYYVAVYPGQTGFQGVEILATLGERPPRVSRNQQNYHLCDTARMTLLTWPPQANRPVYGWRLFNGQVERHAEPIDTTDGSGRLVRQVELTDPAFCGRYDDEQFAVGSPEAPRSDPLGYDFDCEPVQPCPM